MSAQSSRGSKRRRLESEDWLAKEVERSGADMRLSMEFLHDNLMLMSDIVVVVTGEQETKRFPCVSALLASASRPLHAMLYGSMSALEPASEGGKRELRLHATEPSLFEKLLLYIHGRPLALDVDIAVRMHHVADYYEVLPLRDFCCAFLLDAIRPHNCCYLFSRSHEVHCEPLAERCLDFLTLAFLSVVDQDHGFPDLDPAVLEDVLSRDELVCTCEFAVFEALLTWYNKRASMKKYAALPELLRLLRWPMIREEKRAKAMEQLSKLRPPRAHANCVEAGTDAEQEASVRRLDLGEIAATEMAVRLEGGLKETRTRRTRWGRLVGHSPHDGSASPRVLDEHELVCTKDYMIGRSRKTDIRVGQNAPMPYISSQHFRIYHVIQWPAEPLLCHAARAPNAPLPALQPWLEDLSQNGTFVNDQLIGRGHKHALKDGDRIELVFARSQNRAQTAPPPSSFPYYTFSSTTAPVDGSVQAEVSDTDNKAASDTEGVLF